MVKLGMGLLPEDRKIQGLAMILSLSENIVLASLQRLFPRRFVDTRKEREVVAQYIQDLRIATPSPKRLVQFLSGGTPEKVLKWLCTHSRSSSSTHARHRRRRKGGDPRLHERVYRALPC
jgi:ABC-type sugar transport system ATPase subunit